MNKLEEILKEVFHAKDSDYTDETEINQFKEWDSMAHMLLITKIEEEYNIILSGDEIVLMRTVGQIKNIIKQHSSVGL